MSSAPTTSCRSCARRGDGPEGERWFAMLAALDLGHDALAHTFYLRLMRSGLSVEELALMTDEELKTWRGTGELTITRIRTVLPHPHVNPPRAVQAEENGEDPQ